MALLNRGGRNWPRRSGNGGGGRGSVSGAADSKPNDGWAGVSAGLIQTSVKGPVLVCNCCWIQSLDEGSRSEVKAIILLLRQGPHPLSQAAAETVFFYKTYVTEYLVAA